MVTGTLTMIPPVIVLKNGGEIALEELEKKCLEIDKERFGRHNLKNAIETYSCCLKVKEGIVTYDKEAVKYAKYSIMERMLQALLHSAVPRMENWQLYPFLTRKNSRACYIGAPWNIIPIDEGRDYNSHCDFRRDGEDSCRLGCGADKEYFVESD